MRLVVVGAARGWHATRLAAEASRRGHGVTVVEWPLLGAAIDPAARPAVERFLPAAVDAADVLTVRSMPAGRLEEVILRMDLLGRIAARGTPVINAPAALETAIDKYLSLARLAAAGIPVPHTIVAQTPDAIRAAWETLGRDAVVKPLFGSCGRGVERIVTAEGLERLVGAAAEGGAATYLQAFVPHDGWDVRVLLVGPRAFAMRRRARGDWRTNLALGGVAEPIALPPSWLDLAHRAASLLGVEVAGVDLLPGPEGMVVLEVNAVPGWQGLEGATGADVTGAVVDRLAALVGGGG